MRGYWKLKEERVERKLWKTGFGKGCGNGERQKTGLMRVHFVHINISLTVCQ
jgi:hypothetical protein